MPRTVVGSVRGVHASTYDGVVEYENTADGGLGGFEGEVGLLYWLGNLSSDGDVGRSVYHGKGFTHEGEVGFFLIFCHRVRHVAAIFTYCPDSHTGGIIALKVA